MTVRSRTATSDERPLDVVLAEYTDDAQDDDDAQPARGSKARRRRDELDAEMNAKVRQLAEQEHARRPGYDPTVRVRRVDPATLRPAPAPAPKSKRSPTLAKDLEIATPLETSDATVEARPGSVADRVLEALEHGPATKMELAAAVGAARGPVNDAITRLARRGRVRPTGRARRPDGQDTGRPSTEWEIARDSARDSSQDSSHARTAARSAASVVGSSSAASVVGSSSLDDRLAREVLRVRYVQALIGQIERSWIARAEGERVPEHVYDRIERLLGFDEGGLDA